MLKLVALQHPIVGLIEIVGILSILTIGTYRIQIGGMSNEEFGSYFTALIMLIDPISHITTNYNELKQCQASLRRLDEITTNPLDKNSLNNGLTVMGICGGSGGSDTTAVALAHALNADACELYTDVSGVFTTDPRVCEQAKKMPSISFDELLEMTAVGCPKPAMRSVEVARSYGVKLHVH